MAFAAKTPSDRQHKSQASVGHPLTTSPEAAFDDHRTETIAQRALVEMIDRSPQATAQHKFHAGLFESAAGGTSGSGDNERQLEGVAPSNSPAQFQPAPSSLQTSTGLPDELKTGIESLSGMSMDAVRVHYNSSRPARLQALAYAQGTEIHVAPGQERHLPHEAWHVVQQAQGRVTPTVQLKGETPVNDDNGLEFEADVMGGKAVAGGAESTSVEEHGMEGEDSPAAVSFDAGEETHRLWVEEVGGQTIVMVASDPMTVPQRLRQWQKEAQKITDPKLKSNVLGWIQKCWSKSAELLEASNLDDEKARAGGIHNAAAALKELLKPLFWAFKIDLPELGAQAVYRGIHFSNDWMTLRGRSVAAESGRSFESVQAEGTYSGATWELAKGLAGVDPVKQAHLESANRIVAGVLDHWKATTDFTREDNSKTGAEVVKKREAMKAGVQKFLVSNPVQAQQLQTFLDSQKEGFSQSGAKFENQFMAALSRYIDNQKFFETEMAAKSEGGYKDIPFKAIPFISTAKDAGEAVKYAQGKLATDANRSTAGVVGRVLVYVASRVDMLEAGGIDVWQELGAGRLRFTEWRMAENEITFAGKIPDHFLRAMTPVNDPLTDTVAVAATRAEIAAAKAAAPFGGLKPLPRNKPHA